MKNQRAIWGR